MVITLLFQYIFHTNIILELTNCFQPTLEPGLGTVAVATGTLCGGWSRNIRNYPHIPAPAPVGCVVQSIFPYPFCLDNSKPSGF